MPVLKDIALGKYVSVDSAVHRLDPRTKFLCLMVLMTAIVSIPGFAALALFALFFRDRRTPDSVSGCAAMSGRTSL